MKATDLKIGNYLFDYDDKPIRITGIAHDLNNYGGYFLQFGESHSGLIMLDEDEPQYPPIPITTRVLEQCGFHYNEDSEYYILSKNDAFAVDPKDLAFRYIDCWFFDKTTYLHQLQNLYYALTNEELEINL